MKTLAEMMGEWEMVKPVNGTPCPDANIYNIAMQALKDAVELVKHVSEYSVLMRSPDDRSETIYAAKGTLWNCQDWLRRYGFEKKSVIPVHIE